MDRFFVWLSKHEQVLCKQTEIYTLLLYFQNWQKELFISIEGCFPSALQIVPVSEHRFCFNKLVCQHLLKFGMEEKLNTLQEPKKVAYEVGFKPDNSTARFLWSPGRRKAVGGWIFWIKRRSRIAMKACMHNLELHVLIIDGCRPTILKKRGRTE